MHKYVHFNVPSSLFLSFRRILRQATLKWIIVVYIYTSLYVLFHAVFNNTLFQFCTSVFGEDYRLYYMVMQLRYMFILVFFVYLYFFLIFLIAIFIWLRKWMYMNGEFFGMVYTCLCRGILCSNASSYCFRKKNMIVYLFIFILLHSTFQNWK